VANFWPQNAVLKYRLTHRTRCMENEQPSLAEGNATRPGKGMPLGNLTSQLIANIYLHELDWFVKQGLRQKHYVRYCDDFIILSQDREQLLDLVPQIGEFLQERLALTLHPHKITVRSWHQGIDFLGYVLKPNCTLLRTRLSNVC